MYTSFLFISLRDIVSRSIMKKIKIYHSMSIMKKTKIYHTVLNSSKIQSNIFETEAKSIYKNRISLTYKHDLTLLDFYRYSNIKCAVKLVLWTNPPPP